MSAVPGRVVGERERERERVHVRRPPPTAFLGRVVYGVSQPLLGVRMLLTHRRLLEAALVPAALLAAFCAVIALLGHRSDFLHRFYTTFAVLAPLPSILLASHYARLALQARHTFGFSRAEPRIEPLRRSIRRAINQAILITLAVAPISGLLQLVPGVGWLLVQAAAAVWALHWVVVDALDSARVLHPGETLTALALAAERVQQPWYVRGLLHGADHLPFANDLVRRFARLCDRLSMPWREEIALVEEHPAVAVGFALSTAALLAIPVLNLVFRPVVIIGASHVLGQLEEVASSEGAPTGAQRAFDDNGAS